MDADVKTQWCRRWTAPWVMGLVALLTTPALAGPRRTVRKVVTAQVPPQAPAPPSTLRVQATVQVLVKELQPATLSLRALVSTLGAQAPQERTDRTERMTVRLPPAQVDHLLDMVGMLGEVQLRQRSVDDVRPQLDELARRRPGLMARLEAAKAANPARPPPPPPSMEDCEDGCGEDGCDGGPRSRVDWLESELAGLDEQQRQLEDSVARAQVTVVLTTEAPPPEPRYSDRDILFYPGVRVSSLFDVGGTGTVTLLGVGLSLQPAQWVAFEAEFFRATNALSAREGADAFIVSVGLDATSRLFGRGKRKFFNPHLGLRLGVSASFGRIDAVTGVSVGLELVRVQRFVLDVQVRALGQWGNKSGAHLGVQPGLTVATAW